MKQSTTWLTIILLSLSGCDNENNISQNLVQGVIGGEPWEYQFAKAFFRLSDNSYEIEMFGQHEQQSEPCVINSIQNYLSVTLPAAEGTYTLPFSVETGSLKFHLAGVGQQFYVANSGFIEVTSISGRRIIGYIQARFDDDNEVEGNFILDRCN